MSDLCGIPAQRPPKTSSKLANLAVSYEFTIINSYKCSIKLCSMLNFPVDGVPDCSASCYIIYLLLSLFAYNLFNMHKVGGTNLASQLFNDSCGDYKMAHYL